jgi:hypothetical protein
MYAKSVPAPSSGFERKSDDSRTTLQQQYQMWNEGLGCLDAFRYPSCLHLVARSSPMNEYRENSMILHQLPSELEEPAWT